MAQQNSQVLNSELNSGSVGIIALSVQVFKSVRIEKEN